MGGPRAVETGGGSSSSPRCARIFRIGPGSRTEGPQQPEGAKSAKARDGFALGKQSERNQPDVAAAVRALERKEHLAAAIGPHGFTGGVQVRGFEIIGVEANALVSVELEIERTHGTRAAKASRERPSKTCEQPADSPPRFVRIDRWTKDQNSAGRQSTDRWFDLGERRGGRLIAPDA